jgi:hypothetical protein
MASSSAAPGERGTRLGRRRAARLGGGVSTGTCPTAVPLRTRKIGPLIRVPNPHVQSWDRRARTHTRGEPERGARNTEFLILRFVLENYEFMQSEQANPVMTMSPASPPSIRRQHVGVARHLHADTPGDHRAVCAGVDRAGGTGSFYPRANRSGKAVRHSDHEIAIAATTELFEAYGGSRGAADRTAEANINTAGTNMFKKLAKPPDKRH